VFAVVWAVKTLPRGVDTLYVRGHGLKNYDRVCEECYERILRLEGRFRPSFEGYVAVTVVYDSESRSFMIRPFNEHGDGAFLSEDMEETRSFVRDLRTRKVVVLEGDRVVGVI